MPASLFDGVSLGQLATRMVATGFVVIAVAMAVRRMGPVIGGALAGLPIVLGPGFYFLVVQASPAFVARTAAWSLLSLCATQVFLLAYIAAAPRASPPVSLLVAVAAWVGAAGLVSLLPPQPLAGTVLFLVVTLVARRLGAVFLAATATTARPENLVLLLVRGALAGVLVALVTAGASHLGPAGSGLLLAFPIGYTVMSITLHEQLGAASVAATLHSALLGTASLAGFCAMLALAAVHLSPAGAFAAALGTALSITCGLVARSRLRPA